MLRQKEKAPSPVLESDGEANNPKEKIAPCSSPAPRVSVAVMAPATQKVLFRMEESETKRSAPSKSSSTSVAEALEHERVTRQSLLAEAEALLVSGLFVEAVTEMLCARLPARAGEPQG